MLNGFKNGLALGGAIILTFWFLGTLGVGHFHAYYGAQPITCTKAAT